MRRNERLSLDKITVAAQGFAQPRISGRMAVVQRLMRACIGVTLALSTSAAIAAGAADPLPPKTTKTATDCSDGEIFDTDTKTCQPAQDSRFDDDTRYEAARELAYIGDYPRARKVLATMSDQSQSRVQTYYGFIHRKLGQDDLALHHYAQALRAEPDNILALSYLGEAHLGLGNRARAEQLLEQIRALGGDGTWPEQRLLAALSGGALSLY